MDPSHLQGLVGVVASLAVGPSGDVLPGAGLAAAAFLEAAEEVRVAEGAVRAT
jgi:hypothetical protein